MRIFLTGGTGFLGRHLVPRLLQDGHASLILSRDPSKVRVERKRARRVGFIKGDLAQAEKLAPKLKRFRPEVLIHLAWDGIPSDAADLNARNLFNGLAAMRAAISAGAKAIVGVGSCHEYGEPGKKVNEAAPLRPYNTLYAAKVALYSLGSKLAAERGVKFIWLRPGFIYGPGQREKALVPYLVDSLSRGEMPVLRTPSAGNDFVYVADVADAFARAARNYRKISSGAFNVGSGKLTPVAEVARRVYHELHLAPPRQFAKVPRKPEGFFMDITKAKRGLGWRPRTSLAEGIRKTLSSLLQG